MKLRFLSLVGMILALTFSVHAQGFPYHEFTPRTLKQLVEINEKEDTGEVRDEKGQIAKNQFVMRGKILSSVVRVTYTEQTRTIAKERQEFLKIWGETYAGQKNYQQLYESEMLFKEGADEYWLPVQKPVMPYFTKELHKGDMVDLYIIRPGGIKKADKSWDWLFLVEEFQKPKEN